MPEYNLRTHISRVKTDFISLSPQQNSCESFTFTRELLDIYCTGIGGDEPELNFHQDEVKNQKSKTFGSDNVLLVGEKRAVLGGEGEGRIFMDSR